MAHNSDKIVANVEKAFEEHHFLKDSEIENLDLAALCWL